MKQEETTPFDIYGQYDVLMNVIANQDAQFHEHLLEAFYVFAESYQKERKLASTPKVDGWISVDERLPECHKHVLIITNYGGMDVCRFNGELWINSMRPQHSNGGVIYWQPLPTPPTLSDLTSENPQP